jgi:hypothetical protein
VALVLLSSERAPGGRVVWLWSVAPGHRVTVVTEGTPGDPGLAAQIRSQIIAGLAITTRMERHRT